MKAAARHQGHAKQNGNQAAPELLVQDVSGWVGPGLRTSGVWWQTETPPEVTDTPRSHENSTEIIPSPNFYTPWPRQPRV